MTRNLVPHPTRDGSYDDQPCRSPLGPWLWAEQQYGNQLVSTRCPDKYRVFPDDEKPLTFTEALDWWRDMQTALRERTEP